MTSSRDLSLEKDGFSTSQPRTALHGAGGEAERAGPSNVPNPISPELAAAPFRDGGLGELMLRAGAAYLDDYVMGQDDGPDHEPTEFERWLLEDFLNGLMGDDAMFGPVRRVLLQGSAAKELFDALKRNRAALDLIDPMRPLQYATTMDLMRKDMDAAIAKALTPSTLDSEGE